MGSRMHVKRVWMRSSGGVHSFTRDNFSMESSMRCLPLSHHPSSIWTLALWTVFAIATLSFIYRRVVDPSIQFFIHPCNHYAVILTWILPSTLISIFSSILPSTHCSINLSNHPSIIHPLPYHPSIHPSFYTSIQLFFKPSIHPSSHTAIIFSSILIFIHPTIHQFILIINPSSHWFISVSIHPAIHLLLYPFLPAIHCSSHWFIDVSIHPSLFPSFDQSIIPYPSIHPYIFLHPFIILSIYPSINPVILLSKY